MKKKNIYLQELKKLKNANIKKREQKKEYTGWNNHGAYFGQKIIPKDITYSNNYFNKFNLIK